LTACHKRPNNIHFSCLLVTKDRLANKEKNLTPAPSLSVQDKNKGSNPDIWEYMRNGGDRSALLPKDAMMKLGRTRKTEIL
jgi:hypothetical protein